MSAIESMTSLLWNTTQAKDVAKIQLVTQSAENLGFCLNSLLKEGAVLASGDGGSDGEEKVNICHYFIEISTQGRTLIFNFDNNHDSLTLPYLHLSLIIK